MAVMTLNYNSKTIGMHQNITIILPEDDSYFETDKEAKPLKCLMLLHGLSSDETTYVRYTSIERYANEHQLAIVMPRVDHSAYSNMAFGHNYYDYILEVYDYVHQILPLSKDRDDNYIAGHSMGGYGTIKFALNEGDRFSKACPLSAVFDVNQLLNIDWYDFSPQAIVGNRSDITGTDLDVYHLVDEAISQQKLLPELLIMCGTEDFLYEDNKQFIHYLDKQGVPYHFEEDSGEHDYAYWDKAIKQVIEWCAQAN
ncbi:esterase family protein [Staphylococcus sp. 18_1_E_LY]|uniref:S-formylglutathione hydrolase n=1 Tax=Staphylococcus lloydii TaxID=2781774 RepID=A0A7T1B0S8_9STAP|nr:alpha/beta hydrolase family protein [Staphylococcus lloydii]MBF7020308.1 esterase family protein [Staphylococcus lloydii]MBF7027991.1 esterase family protein [Staphylococcus lloydii]QPM75658.1 esterase family protein [Staphylococcus lloydii]